MNQDLQQLSAQAHKASGLLKAMSNPNRLMILCSLIDTDLSVNQLNERIPLSQSALSQHLSALRKAELVETQRQSQHIIYRIKGVAAKKIILILQEQFCPK